MFRKVIILCLVAFGFGACRAGVQAGSVHAGAGVHTDHH